MLRTFLLLVSFSSTPSPTCNASEVARADADLVIAQKLISRAGEAQEKKLARAYLVAAKERRRTALAACTPTEVSAKVNPFALEAEPDPFDPEYANESESAFSDAAFFRAVLDYAAGFGPRVAP